mmetsp:Transcript_27482/g.88734  ORF Transcript_27482/g.88734 Transcript_27482/m.88734 type:complete len:226 (-) Transcript_27482:225-902(-)
MGSRMVGPYPSQCSLYRCSVKKTGEQLYLASRAVTSSCASSGTRCRRLPTKITSTSRDPMRWRPPCADVTSKSHSSHDPPHEPSAARCTLNGRCCCTTSSRHGVPPDAPAPAVPVPAPAVPAPPSAHVAPCAPVLVAESTRGGARGMPPSLCAGIVSEPSDEDGGSASGEPQSATTCISVPLNSSCRLCESGSHRTVPVDSFITTNLYSMTLSSLSRSGSHRQIG